MREAIKKALKKRKLTAYKVAKEMGWERTSIYRYLNGENSLSLERIEAVMQFLNIEITIGE